MPEQKFHRRSVRLQGYDYASQGLYFVTVCTKNRECLFGDIVDGEMRLNEEGRIVEECWMDIPKHFLNVNVDHDVFVAMPNHVHGILAIDDVPTGGRRGKACLASDAGGNCRGVACYAPTGERMSEISPRSSSLGAIIRSFKSAVTKRINNLWGTSGETIWQRNYYDHIIRNEAILERLRTYIQENPAHWLEDEEHHSQLVTTSRKRW